jgi:starch synthase
MIAMRYGAVPVVRRTGGLADTVVDLGLSPRTGTGFLFPSATAHDLVHGVERALATYQDKTRWRGIQERGMNQDFSWRHRAREYVDLYNEAAEIRRQS